MRNVFSNMLLFVGIIPRQLKPLSNAFDDDQVLDLVIADDANDVVTLDFFPVGQSATILLLPVFSLIE